MSVILVRPKNESVPEGVVSTQHPINLGYLASWLKKNNVRTELLDLEVENLGRPAILEIIKKSNPLIVGLSCMTSTITAGHDIAKLVKENFPDLKVVVGGVHSTAIPHRTLKEFPCFDIVMRGEGEITFLELYNTIVSGSDLSKVRGLVYRAQDNNFIDTGLRPLIEDLDILPFPDREFLNADLYKRTHTSRAFSRATKNISEIMTARGCPYSCIFCASKVTFGSKVRYRSVKNIIAEMEECAAKYKTNHFTILDDTFTFKKDVFYPVCDYLKSKKITWDCFTRVDRVDEEMVAKMVESGCEKVSFGLESGSQKMLNLIKKGITIDQIKKAFSICRKSRLRYIEATFMLGNHPLETMDDIKATMDLIIELDPDLMAFSLTAPFPGTELNRIMKEGGYLGEEKWDEFVLYGGTPSWRFGSLKIDELKKIQKDFTRRFYLRPGYIFKELGKIKSLGEFFYWLRIGVSMIKAS
ncbi:MAG: radical SAM protein [Candidatus Omnitrophota bacterium]|nr:radical SAM protein [Candidatus Omnitrophota bacterium]